MKVTSLIIPSYRILKDFSIQFSTCTPVVIGPNGSGKSTMIEALANIFAHLFCLADGRKDAADMFPFYLKYELTNEHHEINSIEWMRGDKGIDSMMVNGSAMDLSRKELNIREFLPSTILLYYSGITDRIEDLSNLFYEEHKKEVLSHDAEYSLSPLKLPLTRPFIYSDNAHLPITFLSLLVNGDTKLINKFSMDVMTVEVVITLKKPKWAKKADASTIWGAEGIYGEFLSAIIDRASGTDIINAGKPEEEIRIITDLYSLQEYVSEIVATNHKGEFLYQMFDFINYNGLLKDIYVSWRGGDNNVVSLAFLSEGEKQIILASGLVELWKNEDGLFLLDEPDTFLHPLWQGKFIEEIGSNLISSQAIITTHSPLMLSSLKDGEIWSVEGGIVSRFPSDSYGMDSNTLLGEAMKSAYRNDTIQILMDKIEALTVEKKISDAKKAIDELASLTSENNPEVIGMRALVRRFELLGR